MTQSNLTLLTVCQSLVVVKRPLIPDLSQCASAPVRQCASAPVRPAPYSDERKYPLILLTMQDRFSCLHKISCSCGARAWWSAITKTGGINPIIRRAKFPLWPDHGWHGVLLAESGWMSHKSTHTDLCDLR